MASDEENRRKIADQFAALGGRPRFNIDDIFSAYQPRGNPVNGPRPARVSATVDDPTRFHVAPESKLGDYLVLGWVVRATIKSDGKPIARVLEWPGAAADAADVAQHPVAK
jgi:hypothetical protein